VSAITIRIKVFQWSVIRGERVLVACDEEHNALAGEMPQREEKFAHGKG